jgi:c(7)-type cytochrome triheme protein
LLFPLECLAQFWSFPPTLPPEQYGNVLIDRASAKAGVKPVAFAHWSHRMRHTCRVCHLELEFEMKANATAITEQANVEGKFCGAAGCHDGKAAFGHDRQHCDACHSGELGAASRDFRWLKYSPASGYGNRVDWTRALQMRLINPKDAIATRRGSMSFDRTLDLKADWSGIPPATFPHKAHVAWLDCANCHPDLFNIEKKTTRHFSMTLNLEGQFCGVCHRTVAFPMQDCKRCHPTMTQ